MSTIEKNCAMNDKRTCICKNKVSSILEYAGRANKLRLGRNVSRDMILQCLDSPLEAARQIFPH